MTYQVFASLWLDRRRPEVSPKPYADYGWWLQTAMDHFGPHPLAAIDTAMIEDFIDTALREREAIERAAATGVPRVETVTDDRGRAYPVAPGGSGGARSTRSSRVSRWCSRTPVDGS